jgi:hypothetical protein
MGGRLGMGVCRAWVEKGVGTEGGLWEDVKGHGDREVEAAERERKREGARVFWGPQRTWDGTWLGVLPPLGFVYPTKNMGTSWIGFRII